MNIWHISDTHGTHAQLKVPKNIDMIIFSGDCSNDRNPAINSHEVLDFIEWFSNITIQHENEDRLPDLVMIAGNHDTSIDKGLISKSFLADKNINYLENSGVELFGYKIWGSPITPTYGKGWSWGRDRAKTYKTWDNIPEDTDILVTHGPPKGILDATINKDNSMSSCGDSNLAKQIKRVQPRLHLFGHIHNSEHLRNSGLFISSLETIIYSNGTVIIDKLTNVATNHGNVITIG